MKNKKVIELETFLKSLSRYTKSSTNEPISVIRYRSSQMMRLVQQRLRVELI